MLYNGTMEEWKQIQKAPNYEVSSLGRVRNATTKRVLVTHENNNYQRVSLRHEDRMVRCKVHRLVAQAFLPDYSEDKQVDHRNRIRDDNRAVNLRMATPTNNLKNRIRSVGEVQHIIDLYLSGKTTEEIYELL